MATMSCSMTGGACCTRKVLISHCVFVTWPVCRGSVSHGCPDLKTKRQQTPGSIAIWHVWHATNARIMNADRKSVVSGKSVSVRVDLGGRRIIKKKIKY